MRSISYAEKFGQLVYPFVQSFFLDGKARPDFLVQSSFNTSYGCQSCLVVGERVSSGRGHCQIFPQSETILLRSKEDNLRAIELVKNSSSPVLGLKGRSPLYSLDHFDPTVQVPDKPMHYPWLGIVKPRFLSMQKFSFRHLDCFVPLAKRKILNDRIGKISVNSNFKRRLESFNSVSTTWKANQLFDFFMNVFIVVFKSILKPGVYEHLFKLVYIVSALWVGDIDKSEIQFLERLIENFLVDHLKFYPKTEQTSNLHRLNHSLRTFKMHGPMKNQNGFVMEAINGECVKMVNGTLYTMEQIAEKLELNFLISLNSLSKKRTTGLQLANLTSATALSASGLFEMAI